jgi:hypothetical protein
MDEVILPYFQKKIFHACSFFYIRKTKTHLQREDVAHMATCLNFS